MATDQLFDFAPTQLFTGHTLEDRVREMLEQAINDEVDWDHPHFKHTPRRWIKMMKELTTGEPFVFTTFPNEGDDHYEGVLVSGPIHFVALCGHHILPFHGRAWVGYVPDDMLCGLSKLARAVKSTSKGLWTQEHLTQTIADFIQEELGPLGLAVRMEAEHLCMSIRGVQSPGTITTTQVMKGVMLDHDRQARAEFLDAVEATR